MDEVRAALDKGDAAKAVELATLALNAVPQSVPFLLIRSTAYIRENEPELALKDADLAVTLADKHGRPDAQLRRAIALFKLREYGKAKSLVKLFSSASDIKQASMWKMLLDQHPEPEEQVPEIPVTVTSSSRSKPPTPENTRYDWYQSSSNVSVSVFHKNTPESASIVINERDISIEHDGYTYKQLLWGPVKSDKSTYSVTPNKIEFTLAKGVPDTRWPQLMASSDGEVYNARRPANGKDTDKHITAPPRSKWDDLKIEDDSEDESEEKGDPNAFFRKLYKDASPDVQRAMIKSYVESNGTALSTNWDDVKKGPVATHPPEDMEAKKW